MKNLLMGVSAFAAIIILMAVAQSDSIEQENQDLRIEVAKLGMRVDHLEHAAGSTPRSSVAAHKDDIAPGRSMIMVSIGQSQHANDHADEIASLQRQHTSLMDTVNNSADQTADDFGQVAYAGHVRGGARGWGGHVSGGYAESNVGAIGRQVLADHEVTNRYATQAAIKKQQLDKLKAADAQPKQIVNGHDGNTIITLETKFNLMASLNDISVGDLVTWTGTRQSADSGSEVWLIDSIKKADQ